MGEPKVAEASFKEEVLFDQGLKKILCKMGKERAIHPGDGDKLLSLCN